MSSVKKRYKHLTSVDVNNNDVRTEDNTDSDEMEPLPSSPSGESLLNRNESKIKFLDGVLNNLNPKWKNWIIRGIFGVIMISSFSFIVYLGKFAITLLILGIQFKCFHEIITIGYVVYKSHDLPWFRTISWYFLLTSNYYLYGENLIQKFSPLLKHDNTWLMTIVTHHRFISFILYLAGFVGFVLSLKKTYYLKQFTLFGYTHLALMIIVTQSNLMIQNVFEGLIWFLLPVCLIHCNDIWAYYFGFFFGKTKLINVSPKKTWEGFIGGALSTIFFGFIISAVLCKYDYMVCPLEYNDSNQQIMLENCNRLPIFNMKSYNWLSNIEISLHPFQIHSLVFSIFASTIGPFGGFFASGFKRAFKIKDFGDTIPGHGGFMDRFDCQLIMASFVNVYFWSFIWKQSPNKLFNQLLTFTYEDQLEFVGLVKKHYNNTF